MFPFSQSRIDSWTIMTMPKTIQFNRRRTFP